MKSVFKRDGYGLFQTLPINTSTTAVHGGYHFQQLTGADVQLWGNDVEISGSVNDATFVKLATSTVSATWQCTDNLGFAYCVDSLNDTPIKTDGTAANTTFLTANSFPLGTMITATPSRLVVAGVSGNTSTLYFSQSNTLTNFVTGPLTTDPFTIIINSPGSRITHIGYFFGKVYWWKDQSFGYADCPNQYTCSITVISNIIGTLDNSSAFWNGTTFETTNLFTSGAASYAGGLGGIFFRGQDNHIYVYDGYQLTRITRKITPTVTAANRKKANSFTQNTSAQFNNGSITPATYLSTTIVTNAVSISTQVAFSTTDFNWSAGTASVQVSTSVFPPNLVLKSTFGAEALDQHFESNNGNQGLDANDHAEGFTTSASNPQQVTSVAILCWNQGASPANTTIGIRADNSGVPAGSYLVSATLPSANCGSADGSQLWNKVALASTTLTANTTYWVYVTASGSVNNRMMWKSQSGQTTGRYWDALNGVITSLDLDFREYISTLSVFSTTGSFISQTFDAAVSTPTWLFNWSTFTTKESDNGGTITYLTQVSSSVNGPWDVPVPVTPGNTIGSANKEFIEYIASFTTTNTSTSPVLSSVTLTTTQMARSTGVYYSVVNNAPNLAIWNQFSVSDFVPGNSTITYLTRAATNSFTVNSSTPAWVLQQKNATVAASTGTFMQMEASFTVTAGTEVPYFNSFSFNWFEGNAADKMYITYFQDAIWFAGSSGTVTTNNFVLYLDLINSYQWLQFSLPVNGFAVENNALYFGDPIQGRIFKFGGVQTDNGSPINSYWKSKDFSGDDPTVQNEYLQADFIFSVAQTTVTYTNLLDQVVSYSLNLPLTSPLNALDVKRGFLLPIGKIGTFYNFKVGDNSANPKWKMLMHKIHYNPLYWKPQTQ